MADDDIESQIKSAISSRSSYFRDQADSLTFEKVRRLLEKDLGLEIHALDTHKRFVKQWLQTCIESASPDNLSENQARAEGKAVSSTEEAQSLEEQQVKNEVDEPNSGDAETKSQAHAEGKAVSSIEEAQTLDERQVKNEVDVPNSGDAEPMEDSPVMGLMTGLKKSNTNVEDTETRLELTETRIKKAIWARASYIRENSESITLAGLRRLLEEDLTTEKHALDPFKKFISQQVDEVLNSPEAPQTIVNEKKKNQKHSQRKVSSKSTKEVPASSGSESDEVEEEEVRDKKRSAAKKIKKSEPVKKRKRTEESSNGAKRKQSKASKSRTNDSSDEEGRDASEDDNSDASAEKHVKKKEIPKPSYGKEVERLKSVIKSCGMSISPAVYKKVKQAPENKREACLIKELKEMLSKEGLSTNPSEKEIKDVKKMKERAKELEGIDLSNIVSSSRRRSTASFLPPPKPKIPDLSESESEESEDEDDDDEEEEEGDEEVENEEGDEDQENGENEGDEDQENGENEEGDED